MAEYKMKNFYAVLDVEQTATEKEIHKAYRKQAQKWHPDVCKEPDAEEQYKEVMHAYEILSDKDERERYDKLLATVGKGLTFDEIFSKFYFHREGAHSPIKGENVEMEIIFTASEVLTKAEKTVQFIRYVNCKDCDGHGYIRKIENICKMCNGIGHSLIETKTPFGSITTEKECGYCDGAGYSENDECESCHTKGKKTEKVNLTFPIPDGVTEGFRLRFRGKGDIGLNGGKNGDLFLVFRQDKKDDYRIRREYDLETRIDVPFDIALIGGEILIPLPNGKKVKMPVKRGTQNGNLLYVQGGGLYNPNKESYGDLTAIANIEVPTVASDEDAHEILRRLNKGSVPVT